jgi:hypothetical protein
MLETRGPAVVGRGYQMGDNIPPTEHVITAHAGLDLRAAIRVVVALVTRDLYIRAISLGKLDLGG